MSLSSKPATLHANGEAAWDISDEVLSVIRREARPGMITLETGAGQSTLAFLQAGTHHTSVAPAKAEFEAIKAEAKERGLNVENLECVEAMSQLALPAMEGPLDIALIDGGHGFPIPAVDWAYLAPRLKTGGLMIVDDVDLWTGAMLKNFMKDDPAWEMEEVLRGRTAVFRLTEPFHLREWTNQPYVVKQSRWSQRFRKAKNLFKLLITGQFGAISAKMANERTLADAARNDY